MDKEVAARERPDAVDKAIAYVWAFPATLLGLVLTIPVCALGASLRVVDGILEVAGGGFDCIISLLPRSCRFIAITFGHVIIGVNHEALAACRAHEHVHVRQYERWGVLFFPLYLGSSLLQVLCGRHAYRDNYFERQARAEGARSNTPGQTIR